MQGKKPYVKQYDPLTGNILNPIEKSYSVLGLSRKERRSHLQKDRFVDPFNIGIRVIGRHKFYAVLQYIAENKKKGHKSRTIRHLIPA